MKPVSLLSILFIQFKPSYQPPLNACLEKRKTIRYKTPLWIRELMTSESDNPTKPIHTT